MKFSWRPLILGGVTVCLARQSLLVTMLAPTESVMMLPSRQGVMGVVYTSTQRLGWSCVCVILGMLCIHFQIVVQVLFVQPSFSIENIVKLQAKSLD